MPSIADPEAVRYVQVWTLIRKTFHGCNVSEKIRSFQAQCHPRQTASCFRVKRTLLLSCCPSEKVDLVTHDALQALIFAVGTYIFTYVNMLVQQSDH